MTKPIIRVLMISFESYDSEFNELNKNLTYKK